MTKALQHIALFCLLCYALAAPAQLVINASKTPQQLVQDVLVGKGITVSNVTFNGSPMAIAEFSGSTNLSLSSGIVMTTGTTTGPMGPQGPNNRGGAGVDNGLPGDPQLDVLAKNKTFDASILEFDFVPSSDTVSFRYVFGSEEYMEYANSNLNDVFAFFLSGVSVPMPPKNIALIPGTSTPVTINNVNKIVNSSYYVDNGDGNASGTAPDGQYIQYDGFTKVFTALATVICNETYHIKLAIADANDGVWDSGVFLEAGSFTSPDRLSINAGFSLGSKEDSIFYEGCGSARIAFNRGKKNTKPLTIKLKISGTATNGTDYNQIPDSIIVPAGVDSVMLTIDAIVDALNEGNETLIIEAENQNPCDTNKYVTTTLVIHDMAPLTVVARNDTTLNCPSKPIKLTAQASGGLSKGSVTYRYVWNNGAGSGSQVTVSPANTTQYIVTVTDTCGMQVAKDTVLVTVVPYTPLSLSVTKDTSICPGESLQLTATANGGRPALTYNWSDNLGDQPVVSVSPTVTNTYTVSVTDSCQAGVEKHIKVNVSDIYARYGFSYNTNANISFLNNSSSSSISWQWDFGDSSGTSTDQFPNYEYSDTGKYTVTLIVTNADGCSDTISGLIIIRPQTTFFLPDAFSPNGDGYNDVFYAYGIEITEFEMKIYDRWGELIFETKDIRQGWDGKIKGDKAQADVYVVKYLAKGHLEEDEVKGIQHVTLIR